jgi:hypothetical protein
LIQNPLFKIKTKLSIDKTDTSKDDLLLMYLDDAKYLVLGLINDKEVPILLNNVLIDLAVIQYNRMGNEGIKSYSEGGISVSFEESIPADLKKQILKFRKLPR